MRLLGLMVFFPSFFWVSLVVASNDCNPNSPVTKDVLECASSAYKRVDKKLNEQYRILVSGSKFPNKDLLLEGERAWIKYRDAHCNNVYKSIYPGEEAGIEKVGCLVSLASSRFAELVYLETGAVGDGFYSSLSIMNRISTKTREEILSYIESLDQGSEESEYYKKNCELTLLAHAEEEMLCQARMKFQVVR
ncbi:lysozyme inhibitor LprI family protein [Pseudomonas sp. VI4.1]|uniref:lysozyme inhibitor LprI family protein n=1 Tax=Pseudomonas sp. VI4.1 TaxID=1941346 RepID=UPI0009C52573|nr:lysozyme inhibitor LprI family protein [Pseudomonas sp. VI4.1]OPK10921.1 hypothetical protein BZ163_07300 [Pseudomonas sp. VI4.1]